MKTFQPLQVPSDPKQLPAFLMQMQLAIAQAANSSDKFMQLQPLAAAPTRPSDGMVVYLTAAAPDAAAGAGFYGYSNSAWVHLG